MPNESTTRDNISQLSTIVDTLIALFGASVVIAATSTFGPGLSPDSITYISAAESLLSSGALLGVTGSPYVNWPPLFPLAIAIIELLGVSGPQAARLLNAICFGASAGMASYLTRRMTRQTWTGLTAGVVTVLTVMFLDPFTRVLSEPLFIVLVLIFVAVSATALRRQGDLKYVVLAALLAACAALTRYIGVTVLVTGAIVLTAGVQMDVGGRLRRAALFLFVSGLPLALWVARNFILVATPTGSREGSQSTLAESLRSMAVTTAQWVTPLDWIQHLGPYKASPLALLIVLVVLLGSVWWIVWSLMTWAQRAYNDGWASGALFVLATFVVVYLTSLALVTRVVATSYLGARFLAPVFVPILVILMVAGLETWLHIGRGRYAAFTKSALVLMLSSCLLLQAHRTVDLIRHRRAEGTGGYESDAWQNSPLLEYIRTYELDGHLVSNAPDVLYLATGQRTPWSPGKPFRPQQLDSFARIDEDVYVVWFDRVGWRHYLMKPAELAEFVEIVKAVEKTDGTIYKILAPRTSR